MGASVCRKSSKLPSPRPVARPLALTMPMVTVWPRPRGLPKASTTSPTRMASESPKGSTGRPLASILSTARSLAASRPTTSGVEGAPVGELDLHLLRVLHHVVVRDDVAVGAHDHPRPEAALAVRLEVFRTPPEAPQKRRETILALAEGKCCGPHHPLRADGDDGGRHLGHEVGVAARGGNRRRCPRSGERPRSRPRAPRVPRAPARTGWRPGSRPAPAAPPMKNVRLRCLPPLTVVDISRPPSSRPPTARRGAGRRDVFHGVGRVERLTET